MAKIDAMGLGRPSGPWELFTRHAAHDVRLFVLCTPKLVDPILLLSTAVAAAAAATATTVLCMLIPCYK